MAGGVERSGWGPSAGHEQEQTKVEREQIELVLGDHLIHDGFDDQRSYGEQGRQEDIDGHQSDEQFAMWP